MTMPITAETDSWKPISKSACGQSSKILTTASDRQSIAVTFRRRHPAIRPIVDISAARQSDIGAPTNPTKFHISISVMVVRITRGHCFLVCRSR